MSEHPNASQAREGFERFVSGDRALGELEDGRWKVVRAQPLDQAAFDAFWAG